MADANDGRPVDRRAALGLLRKADATVAEILDTALQRYGGGLGPGESRGVLGQDSLELNDARQRWNEVRDRFARADHDADDLVAAGDLAIAWHKRPLTVVAYLVVGTLIAVQFIRVSCG